MTRMRTVGWTVGVIMAGALTIGAGEAPTGKDGVLPGKDGVPMGKDGAPMVLIPEGAFTMGSNEGLGNERPEHKVFLNSYYIDQYEVTIARYAKFLQATGHKAPPLWDEDSVESAGNRPAVGLDWNDADAYCKWAGKRLPTEAEWEKAARGTDGRRYPWGHMQPFPDIANYNRGQWVSYAITLNPVETLGGMSVRHGTKEGGKSPYGLYQMAGNAAEWVADWYDREYYGKSQEKNPTGPKDGEKRVIRGGSWSDSPAGIRSTARVSAEPDYRDLTLGVRCAMDVPK
ncbi:MAG: formylglycine-generating enzyme family protein [Nitrospirae bacterium]|nr:formylglycine-generating enzyme family protein [Nitrospirota bacterium]